LGMKKQYSDQVTNLLFPKVHPTVVRELQEQEQSTPLEANESKEPMFSLFKAK
jgi:hypothetical protein